MNLDHLAKVTERLMEDKNFRLQDILSLYVAYKLDIELRDRVGKDITLDGADFIAKLERMIDSTSEDIRDEEREEKRLA